MFRLLSIRIAKYIARIGNQHDANIPVLAYGMELIITSVVGLLLLILLSLAFGKPFAWLYFVLGFAPLRTTAGGFHAKTHSACFTITLGMFVVSYVFSYQFLWISLSYLIISFISLLITVLFSPVEATNKPLTPIRKKLNRRRSIVIVAMFGILACILFTVDVATASLNLLYLGIASAVVSLLVSKISIMRKGGLTHESQGNARSF